jgi:hypothetical protein
MRAEVLRQTLRSYRRATVWWVVGIAAFLVVNVASYPAFKGETEYDDLLDNMPDAMLALFGIERGLSLTSPEGYLIRQVFGFVLPMCSSCSPCRSGRGRSRQRRSSEPSIC